MPLLMCPNCQAGMKEVARNGVQIDICPQCRGVWLDRGELEKLLGAVRQAEAEWSAEPASAPPPPPAPPNVNPVHYQAPPPQYHPQYDPKHYKKKKNPFTEIFDIFD